MIFAQDFVPTMVDTGQIYLRHKKCNVIDYSKPIATLRDAIDLAEGHRCDPSRLVEDWVEVPCPGGNCPQYLYGSEHKHEIKTARLRND